MRYKKFRDPYTFCLIFYLLFFLYSITRDPDLVVYLERRRPYFTNKTWNFPPEVIIYNYSFINSSDVVPYFKNQIYVDDDFNKTFVAKYEHEHIEWVWSIESTYFIVNDTYVNGFGAVICNHIWCREPIYMSTHFKMTDGIIEQSVDEAIYLCNAYMHMFAHVLMDCFAPFLLLPENVRKKIPMIICTSIQTSLDIYEALGYNPNTAIVLSERQNWIHVKRLHTIIGAIQLNCHFGLPYYHLYKELHKGLKLDQQDPTLLVLYNRPPNHFRRFENFQLLVTIITRKYSSFNWQQWDNIPIDVKQAARMWNSVKLVFMPTGSNVANVIYMHQKACLCVQYFDWYDTPAMFAIHSVNLPAFMSVTHRCHHFYNSNACLMNIKSAAESIDKALQYMHLL